MDEAELAKYVESQIKAKKREPKTFPFFPSQHPWENDERYGGIDEGPAYTWTKYPPNPHLTEEELEKQRREGSKTAVDPSSATDPVLFALYQKADAKWRRRFWVLLVAIAQGIFVFELYQFIFGDDDWAAYFSFLPLFNVRATHFRVNSIHLTNELI